MATKKKETVKYTISLFNYLQMQQSDRSGVHTSPTPGVLETTPPPPPHKKSQLGVGGLTPPLISLKSALLKFLIF